MIQTHWLVLGLLIELTLLFGGGLVAVLVVGLMRRRRDIAAVSHLAERTQKTLVARRSRLEGIVAALPADESGSGAPMVLLGELLATERGLYKHLATLYLHRDAEAIGEIDARQDELLSLYHAWIEALAAGFGKGGAAAEEQPAEVAALEAEIARLRADNERLADETRITMDTLGKILTEYANLYGRKGQDEEVRSVTLDAVLAFARQYHGVEDEAGKQSSGEAEPSAPESVPEEDELGEILVEAAETSSSPAEAPSGPHAEEVLAPDPAPQTGERNIEEPPKRAVNFAD